MTSEREFLARPAPPPEVTVRYAAGEDGVIDIHLPADDPSGRARPLVVLVHGGFWRQRYDRTHLRPLAGALAGEGFLVAVVEYRRVGGGGGWPVTATDVEAAVLALRGLLDTLGHRASTTTVVGHSAGGQLVLWMAGRGRVRVDLTVALAPVADLRSAARDLLGDGAVQDLLGGGPSDVPDCYAEADPLQLFEECPDPRGLVVLMHGTDDDVVPVSQSRAFAARHPSVGLIELDRLGHYEAVDPRSAAWPKLLAVLARAAPSAPGQ